MTSAKIKHAVPMLSKESFDSMGFERLPVAVNTFVAFRPVDVLFHLLTITNFFITVLTQRVHRTLRQSQMLR